jgi:predicted methyltransferase
MNRIARAGLLVAWTIGAIAAVGSTAEADAGLHAAIDGPQRGAANRARDIYRHPEGVLEFFGLNDNMTVVEAMPGPGGWWTEILAPYLRDRGRYYVAVPDQTKSAGEKRANAAFAAKLAAAPAIYGKVVVTHLDGDKQNIAPPGSADLVMTFRNLHDWLEQGVAEADIRAFYKALKPGGVFGIVDHRARVDRPLDPMAKSGYVRTDFAVKLIEAAGFKLAGSSEINANPKDDTEHPEGVWTLPPTLRLKDKDRAKYLAIGESDRFTLKFIKPASP